jgi:hypothetical protein
MSFKSLFEKSRGPDYDKPAILWYPSGGFDWFPLVGFSQGFRADLSPEIQALTKPDLFVYTCLEKELPDRVAGVILGSGVLFEDDKTLIHCLRPRRLRIDREQYGYEICGDYVETFGEDLDPLRAVNFDALSTRVRLIDKQFGHEEDLELLYILGENINFFNSVVCRGYAEVLHLCAIREGCGFGGGRRSIIEHVYQLNPQDAEHLKPETIVAFRDFTYDIIRSKLQFDFLVHPRFLPNTPGLQDVPDHAFVIGEGVVLKMRWH